METKRSIWNLFKTSFAEFQQADCSDLAAALSYYTVFSLAPMLIVIIAVSSFFLGQQAVTGELFHQIRGLVGNDAARTLQTMMRNAYKPGTNTLATVIGTITLVLGSTGIFSQIQSCLN